ncbi:MAG: carboxypeptidase-like regulatory domain-containing protein [Gemmataceae bacterium]
MAGMGCGKSKKGAKVSGTVKYQGQPLPSGSVTFFDAKKQIVGTATIKDGSYSMVDVPTGNVMISVTTPPSFKPDPKHPAPQGMKGSPPPQSVPIPLQYGNPEKSGLSYEVKSGKQDHPIDLR